MAPLLQFATNVIARLPKVKSRFGEVNRYPRSSIGLPVGAVFTAPQFFQELMDVLSQVLKYLPITRPGVGVDFQVEFARPSGRPLNLIKLVAQQALDLRRLLFQRYRGLDHFEDPRLILDADTPGLLGDLVELLHLP